jgi:hypothetical protein
MHFCHQPFKFQYASKDKFQQVTQGAQRFFLGAVSGSFRFAGKARCSYEADVVKVPDWFFLLVGLVFAFAGVSEERASSCLTQKDRHQVLPSGKRIPQIERKNLW